PRPQPPGHAPQALSPSPNPLTPPPRSWPCPQSPKPTPKPPGHAPKQPDPAPFTPPQFIPSTPEPWPRPLTPRPRPPQFEWAWQHPAASRRLPAVSPRRRREQPIAFALRLLPRLLRAPPWSRLPLRLRWLRPPPDPAPIPAPPPHMAVEVDPRGLRPRPPRRKATPPAALATPPGNCSLCRLPCEGPDSAPLRCPRPGCPAVTHALCLAPHFLREEPRELLPLRGACPGCQQDVLWGDLIRHYHGYHDDDEEEAGLEDPELGHWTDELLLRWGAGPGRGSAPSCTS
uniref:Structure-specific endonuclease subunit SLX1 C-terminal domain-containing protein n=1 Tax=Cairina moschata TaxID=8855 RepID=A0A8C3BXG2_CAIMO